MENLNHLNSKEVAQLVKDWAKSKGDNTCCILIVGTDKEDGFDVKIAINGKGDNVVYALSHFKEKCGELVDAAETFGKFKSVLKLIKSTIKEEGQENKEQDDKE